MKKVFECHENAWVDAQEGGNKKFCTQTKRIFLPQEKNPLMEIVFFEAIENCRYPMFF